jgi:hypothetical protein
MRNYLAAAVAIIFSFPLQAATTPSTDAGGNESLGGKLLDDLAPGATEKSGTAKQPQSPRDETLVPRTPPRVPATSAAPLARIQQGMQNAQALLAEPAVDKQSSTIKLAGPVQQDVVSQLDKLIAELSKQCQGQCQGGQSDKPPDPNQNGKPKPGKSGTAAGSGKAPARDSSDRLDRASAQPVDKGDVNELVKELWGHLPERAREQMLQSFSDEFLPKYEQEIQQYYRRLSEEQSDNAKPR